MSTHHGLQVLLDKYNLDEIKQGIKNPIIARDIEVLSRFKKGESPSSVALSLDMPLAEVRQIAERFNRYGLQPFVKEIVFNPLDDTELLKKIIDAQSAVFEAGRLELPIAQVQQIFYNHFGGISYSQNKIKALLQNAGLKRVFMTDEEYRNYVANIQKQVK